MNTSSFTTTLLVDQTPEQAFNAINNVRGWWSETLKGSSEKLNDEFTYQYKGMHSTTHKLTEVIPNKKVVWLVTDSYLSFVQDHDEWTGTTISFDISGENDKTKIVFTHHGLTNETECFDACSKGWTYYIQQSLLPLITTGKGKPNPAPMTTQQVAARFMELAMQEKWFEIQDELFADNVKSIEPEGSPYFGFAEGKENVRKKGEDFVKRIEAAHLLYTSQPIIAGNHFAVSREKDLSVQGHGRVHINQIMMYEVKDGRIISEQFFY